MNIKKWNRSIFNLENLQDIKLDVTEKRQVLNFKYLALKAIYSKSSVKLINLLIKFLWRRMNEDDQEFLIDI